jgi:hypothetical protein
VGALHRRVQAAARDQLVVGPDLGRPAALEHDDAVGRPDRREAVRDHQRRPVQGQARQRLLDQTLGLGVDRRGRLVQDQDRRVLQERPRDREPLLLAARQPHAPLADHRVVPAR